jgi:fatty-acyl-CoA synthase
MLGYWNDPVATEAAFLSRDGRRFLRTGDIGRRDADGYFYLTDRLKRMISVSGFKVWPTEVEAILQAHPAIAEICVVSRPDARTGEAVTALVVPRGAATQAEIVAWARANMSAYKCPTRVRLVPALPRSPSGKVQWREAQAALDEEESPA